MQGKSDYLQSLGALSTLPPELRNIVYKYVLVGPPMWERPHSADCCRCTPNACRPIHDCQRRLKRVLSCRCRVREGTSLLRVNKAIHAEASHIFWTKNTFCFISSSEFIAHVSGRLRPEHRSLLRHIYIIGPIRPSWLYSSLTSTWFNWEQGYEKLWFETTIRQCTGLRTLAIDIDSVCPLVRRPAYLDMGYIQVLAGMVSPRVHFSFLHLRVLPMIDLSAMPGHRFMYYDSLYQMPYNLHDEAIKGETTTSKDLRPVYDWEPVYGPPYSGKNIMPVSHSSRL
ncbi:hypothetical protein F5Y10DRAFT_289232 [Nemania abortiva]|nr:hypothetical protein F5Y10DRAFT_289232 [Nemania abortiva]